MSFLKIDTIVAISTPLNSGAIGIIRLSGPETLSISQKLLSKNQKPLESNFLQANTRKAIYCEFGLETKIDKILYIYFPSPHSYTGEEMGEFSFHGNIILLKTALQLFFKVGARPAERGEFTKRAYLNGKIDLTSAEAIAQIIHARSQFELELAQKNAFGEIHKLTSMLRSELLNLKAECEAEIDFSTEDLTFESMNERINRIKKVSSICKNTLDGSNRANSLIEKAKVVIFGPPNAGKSSLMNLILGRERAIVSEIPGTTRDYLAEDIHLEGLPIRLVDTAGVRTTSDKIEQLGIEKSKKEFETANVKIVVLDAGNSKESKEFLVSISENIKNSIIVINKIDEKSPDWNSNEIYKFIEDKNGKYFEISCKTQKGIPEFVDYLNSNINSRENSENLILLEDRNKYLFQRILDSLDTTLHLIDNKSPAEIYVKEIDDALISIGQINGKIDTEEILGRVFSKFCIGK